MSEPLKVLDLFSGIGGFSLGLERTGGFKTVAFCEIEEFPWRVLAKHWPGVPIHRDVRELRAEHVGTVDVICGGFPCQDISTAGKGAGLAGERSGLWREYARLVGEIRPAYVIVENVAALLGRGLGTVLGDLAALGMRVWWDCIPAAAVGAPHLRDRVWIVAYPGGEQHEGFCNALRWSIAAQLSQASMADAAGQRCGEARQHRERSTQRAAGGGSVFTNAPSHGRRETLGAFHCETGGGEKARYAVGSDAPGERQWFTEPDVGRVAHGVPSRVDRLRGLGNAVVPQIPEIIGRAILAALSPTNAAVSHPEPGAMWSERSERATSLLPAKEGE